MPIELTPQQQAVVQQSAGEPIELIDPQTHQLYVLVERDQFVRGSDKLKSMSPTSGREQEVAEGIRLSQEALRSDLPKLLDNPKLRNQWVAYRGQQRIGIASDSITLLRECVGRGYKPEEYYIGWINECELVEVEELEPRPWGIDNDETTEPSADL